MVDKFKYLDSVVCEIRSDQCVGKPSLKEKGIMIGGLDYLWGNKNLSIASKVRIFDSGIALIVL